MFNRKTSILLVIALVGFVVCGLSAAILLDSSSEPVVFESDESNVSYVEDSYDENTDFDSDFDPDFDSDMNMDEDFDSEKDEDFDNEQNDFDVSTNYYSIVTESDIDEIGIEEYKNTFDLSFDLWDVEKYINKKYPGEHYRIEDIIVDKNENTDSGYNANVRVDFKGDDDTILRQGVILSYDLDETFNNWDYKGYELVGTENIYFDSLEAKKIPSDKTGTFVYEAINIKIPDKGQFRKLYVYSIAPGTAMEYLITVSCITLVNDFVNSSDYINRTGDASVHPREPAKYNALKNGLVTEYDKMVAFTYNENGGISHYNQYIRISDDVLTPQEIAEKWVNR